MIRKTLLIKTALLGCILSAAPSFAQNATITNDVFWKDTDGNNIYSQGGGGIWVGDTYYWYGVKYNGAVTYANNPTSKNEDIGFAGVTCYSSKDLVHWKNEGLALAPNQVGMGWFGRVGVVYNAKTKLYVLAAQGASPSGSYGEYFATSSTPDGEFKFKTVQTDLSFFVNGGTGDQTTFQDDDGKAYIICSNVKGRSNLYVAPLRESDFLAIEPTPTRVFRGASREGNAMFKHNGTYYFCSSDLHGWNSSHTYCISSKNILGPYGPEFVMEGTDPDFTHVTQTGFFISVKGSKQSFVINAGDRWSDFAGNGLGYNQWVPMTFEKGTPKFHSMSQWNLNVATGEWSVGAKNNYAINPTFEADRVLQPKVAGWTVDPVDANNINSTSNKRTGRFGLYLTGTKTASQTISDLPNGLYSLSVWVRSSGSQTSANLFAKGFGGSELKTPLNTSISAWTKKVVNGIQVTNGTLVFGVQTAGSTSQWLNVDDFELLKSEDNITITTEATPGGRIVQNPDGNSLSKGSKAVFTAIPLAGWKFAGWSGDYVGTDSIYTIATLANNVNLKASFSFTASDSSLYEGEDALLNNAISESTNTGFSGKGYANFDNTIGSSIEFAVCVGKSGEQNVQLTYSNGSTAERPVSVSVNGKVVLESLTFPTTDSWSTWKQVTQALVLNAGVNTIKLTSLSADGGPNIDKLEILNDLPVFINPEQSNSALHRYDEMNHTLVINSDEISLNIQLVNIFGGIEFTETYKSAKVGDQIKLPVQNLKRGVYLLKVTGNANKQAIQVRR